MATNYWDYYRQGTQSTASTFPISTCDTSTCSNWYYNYVPRIITRKIIVEKPEKWSEEQNMKFVELVNIKTKTGWKVTLVIKGDILITDPDVEKRSMIDFIPLLKNDASMDDIKQINEFFESNSCGG